MKNMSGKELPYFYYYYYYYTKIAYNTHILVAKSVALTGNRFIPYLLGNLKNPYVKLEVLGSNPQ